MKTTLDLPDDLMREVKIRAATQGKKLKDVMADTLRNGLYPASPIPPAIRPIILTDPELGYRVVKGSPNPPFLRMTLEEILKLEQDALYQEDLQRVGSSI